jgi:hypothetical protein
MEHMTNRRYWSLDTGDEFVFNHRRYRVRWNRRDNYKLGAFPVKYKNKTQDNPKDGPEEIFCYYKD